MRKQLVYLFILCFHLVGVSQQTIITGTVSDAGTGEKLPYVSVRFVDSKIGTLTDSVGGFKIETYYATDSLRFSLSGFVAQTIRIKRDESQQINVQLGILTDDLAEIVILTPDEFPSTRLHKRMVANKPINNKEKLNSYEYDLYSKIQFDLSNLDDNFGKNGVVKRLDLIMDYLDSTSTGENYLPLILSENYSNFYFKNNPKIKKELIQGTKITGIDNLQINQFLGDMYLDVNVYDNVIDVFNKSFISPTSPIARSYYKFFLEDSSFIDNDWCYKLRFLPKRSGDLTFTGEMWIHDTTYAIKLIKASIAPDANLNFIQDLYLEHRFDQVEKEVWMLKEEKLIADIKITQKTKVYGIYARKNSTRRNYVINSKRDPEFYTTGNAIQVMDSAKIRPESYWQSVRTEQLTQQQEGIVDMVDSLNNLPFFQTLKNLTYFSTTGYYPLGKLEYGSAFTLLSFNQVEKFRMAFALRTSNNFSKRLELGGRIAYGFGDERFKYGLTTRFNITPKKRGMMTAYYTYDIEQIGQSPTAASMGSTFATVLSTAPFDKLTFVKKTGISLEKDIKKDVVIFSAFDWKEFTPLGLANYLKLNQTTGLNDTISNIRTAEVTARFRWTKDEEFLAGQFDRTSLRSVFPILSIQAIFGIKGIAGSQYNYQKLEFQLEHNAQVGIFGRMRYGAIAGYIFGNTAYPLLKVHEGNQSLWLLTSAFNKLNFLEFISDRYVGAFIENHWEGLLFDRIPINKKLKWRLLTTGRVAYGAISARHEQEMLIPTFVKRFGNVPYVESSVGIENIFKALRVDLVWRMTHQIPGISPLGVRARISLNF
ncbi:MAG: DUF5686 and carboxypeptidase regulatory-like domain-containing protein [Crocinitomicaceae bacterium]|nr:DUF5686 and carboxypeptidase regulatory-like domain-containing protein [Crocinitomicaceae bacterium]